MIANNNVYILKLPPAISLSPSRELKVGSIRHDNVVAPPISVIAQYQLFIGHSIQILNKVEKQMTVYNKNICNIQ